MEAEISRWQMEFRLDDHSLWEQDSKNGPKNPNPNRKKWDDIRERMETEVMLFSNEASEGEGELKEQLRVSNRSRYDYKEFLRKFTVLHEEMQIDPDSFDYHFLPLRNGNVWEYAADRAAGDQRGAENRRVRHRY